MSLVNSGDDLLVATTVAVSELQAKIDEARGIAACLVHAYDTGNRPPHETAKKARAWLRRNIEAAE